MRKFLRIVFKIATYLVGFSVLTFGSCEVVKYQVSKPIRELCKNYPIGQQIQVREFLSERSKKGILEGGLIILDNKPTPSKPNYCEPTKIDTYEDVLKKAKLIDDGKMKGQVSARVSLGILKFSCEISFADGLVTENEGFWWD